MVVGKEIEVFPGEVVLRVTGCGGEERWAGDQY